MAGKDGQVSGRFLARRQTTVPAHTRERVLRDGTVITKIVISHEQGDALVEGFKPDGTPFSIIRSLTSVGL